MIIWILLIALVITAAATLVGVVFGRAKSKSYRKGIYIGVGVCAVLERWGYGDLSCVNLY